MSNCTIGDCARSIFNMDKHDICHIIRILMKFTFKLCLQNLTDNMKESKLL
jgi:hypothetical protein